MFKIYHFFFFVCCVVASGIAAAQDPADIFHKTIDLDSINEVRLDVYESDQVIIKQWPGDDILIETNVKLNNGKPHILDFFLKKGRWELEENVSGQVLSLVSKDKVRRVVKGTENTTSETVVIVVYMPENFSESGAQVFHREEVGL